MKIKYMFYSESAPTVWFTSLIRAKRLATKDSEWYMAKPTVWAHPYDTNGKTPTIDVLAAIKPDDRWFTFPQFGGRT